MSRFAAVVLAAGRSSRFADPHHKKPFVDLGGRAVWTHSVERFTSRDDVCQTLLVIAPDDREEFARRFGASIAFMGVDLCSGGAERADSVAAALANLSPEATHVAIHDGARPLVTDGEVNRVFAAASDSGAAILATPVTATLKQVSDHSIEETVPRDRLWAAQTPQAFEIALFRGAVAAADGAAVTDDAQYVERLGRPVTVVEGSTENIKITTQEDLRLAKLLHAARTGEGTTTRRPFADDDLWE